MSDFKLLPPEPTPGPLGPPLSPEYAPRPAGYGVVVRGEAVLRDYWYVLLKRKWSLIASVVIFVTVATIATLRMTPMYEARARIVVNEQTPEVLRFKDSSPQQLNDNDLDTQLRIVQSEQVAVQAARDLRAGPVGDDLVLRPSQGADRPQELAELKRTAGQIRAGLTVSLIPDTRIIEISHLNADPKLAADIANAVATAYIEQNFRTKYESTMQAADWLSKQLGDLQLKVETSQAKLAKFQQENQIVGLDDKQQNIVTTKLDDLNKQLTQAEGERIQREASYRMGLVTPPQTGTPGQASLHENLRQQEVDLKRQLAQVTTQFGPSYPKVLELKNQLSSVEAALKKESGIGQERLKNEYLAAVQREKLLREAFEAQKREANQLNAKGAEYSMLKREAESNRQLYDGLLQKMKEAGITASLRSSNIRIMDLAEVPTRPSKPNIPRNLGMALLLGVALGVALAFTLEALDNTVHAPEQVESLTGLPALGIVPLIADSANPIGRKRRRALPAASATSPQESLAFVTLQRPRSEISEAYRALRTSILLSSPKAAPRVLLVTSSLPEDGKTTTSINTAIVLAQKGERVLLVDADLRRPSIHRSFGLQCGIGLSSALSGLHRWEEAIAPSPDLPNLHVLPAGPVSPHPAELLGSETMRELIAAWRQQYDRIVIDSPPVLSVTDAVLLSVWADATVLVIRFGRTTKLALCRAQEVLQQVNARVMGVVLNAVNLSSPDSYSYYYYGSKYDSRYYHDEAAKPPETPSDTACREA